MSQPEPARVVTPVRSAAVMTHRRAEMTERALAQLWPVVERADRQVLAGFSEAEAAQLRAFLERIQRNCAGLVGS